MDWTAGCTVAVLNVRERQVSIHHMAAKYMQIRDSGIDERLCKIGTTVTFIKHPRGQMQRNIDKTVGTVTQTHENPTTTTLSSRKR